MKTISMLAITALLTLSACAGGGEIGDECTSDDDCADGLECHFHDHGDEDSGEEEEEHGECEEHEE